MVAAGTVPRCAAGEPARLCALAAEGFFGAAFCNDAPVVCVETSARQSAAKRVSAERRAVDALAASLICVESCMGFV
jgi:hypothetical protein